MEPMLREASAAEDQALRLSVRGAKVTAEAVAAALVDFQIAWTRGRRGRLFRLLAREDLRHLLKHKRTYCDHALSARQHAMLKTPALHSRLWRATGKRLYKLIARRVFGYWDNEGKGRVRD